MDLVLKVMGLLVMTIFAVTAIRTLVVPEICRSASAALRDYLVAETRANRCNVARVCALYDRLGRESDLSLYCDLTVWTPKQAFPWVYELRAA